LNSLTFIRRNFDHTEISKNLTNQYFFFNNFKIVMLQNEVSFYFCDTKVGMYILFMKVSWYKLTASG
jgi:hypothetical protein